MAKFLDILRPFKWQPILGQFKGQPILELFQWRHVLGLFKRLAFLRPPKRQHVLGPFKQPKRQWYLPNYYWLLSGLLLMFCLFYGFAFALTVPFIVVPYAVPIVFLLFLVIWVMPRASAPTKSLNLLFFAFLVGLIVWPNYLSIALPGLPWISVIRLTVFPLTLIFLLCASVSKEFRNKLGAVLKVFPLLWKFLAAFVCIQIVSIFFSSATSYSIEKFVVAQTEWTAIFFISCYVFLKQGRPAQWAACLWIMGVWVGAIGIWESRLGYVPWRGHIPAFLQIDDPIVLIYLGGSARSATGIHRVQSTFSTSLGLSEYLALTLPFVIYFLRGNHRWIIRVAAALTIPFFLYVVILTDSRLGVVGFLLTFLAFTLVWAIKRWREERDNPLWLAIISAYPVIFSATIAATFFVGRLRARVWGNGPQQASTEARIEQYTMGIPKILSHPFGYGIGMGGDALGFIDGSGFQTIDSYYLLVVLEYGILGFVIYYGMIFLGFWYAGVSSLSAPSEKGESALVISIMVSLLNFLVIKGVFSNQDNHPLVFMMLGMLAALAWRRARGVPD